MKRMHKIKRPQLRKELVIFLAVCAGLLASLFYKTAYAFPVPPLPGDNLVVNPWFRQASNSPNAGFYGWTLPLNEGVTWGPSQKESNPSPEILVSGVCGFREVYCGTAARWAQQFGVLYPNIDVYAFQVVAADPSQRNLKFSAYYVSHMVEVGAVNIYAGNSPDGPWELLWVPLYHTEDQHIIPESRESVDLWLETGLLEFNFEQGYPYYKIELHSRLPEAPAADGLHGVGFKITGIYFSTAYTDEPGAPPPTPGYSSYSEPTVIATAAVTDPISATPTATLLTPTPESTSVAEIETETAEQAVTTLTAEAISPTEILLAWSENQRRSRGLRLERSSDMVTGWQSIAALQPGVSEFVDSGLPPDTVYYYRLRVSQDETLGAVSARTLSEPESPLAAPTMLRALSAVPLQVELNWSDLSGDEDGFQVERSPDGLVFTPVETLGADATSFIDADLDPNVYYYRVRSYREDTFSDYSEVVRIEVPDRRLEEEEGGEAVTGAEAEQTSVPEAPAEPAITTPPQQSSLVIVGLAFLTLLIGVGLGIVLTGRRT